MNQLANQPMMFNYLGALHRQVEDLRKDPAADKRVTAALGLIEEALRLTEMLQRGQRPMLVPNPPGWLADVIADSQRQDLQEGPSKP